MSMGRSNIPAGYNNRAIGGGKLVSKSKNFIKKAVGNNKGVFKKKAEDAGMSTAEYAEKEKNAPGKLGKQARLAKTLMKLNKKKGK